MTPPASAFSPKQPPSFSNTARKQKSLPQSEGFFVCVLYFAQPFGSSSKASNSS